MAERYRREKGLPAYQPGDVSGFFAGAQETGRQAAAVGQQAQALGQQARVLENVSNYFDKVGAKLAKQHGMQKAIGPMRDKDGNMVPLVHRVSLNISDQVYQERQVEAWGASALNLYKERSQTEAEKFRMDPEGYANAMTEVREQILANAPGSLSGVLAQQMEEFSTAVGSGIDSFVNKQERETRDFSIGQGIDRAQDSFLISAIRDGENFWDPNNPAEPNPELYGPESDIGQMFASVPALSSGEQPDDEFTPQHDALAAEINRKGLLAWFDAKANGARQMYHTDPVRARNTLMQLQRMVEDDQVRVPGWTGKYSEGMSGINFSNLSRDAQQTLRTEMGRMSERIEAEATYRNDLRHEMFQERVGESMQELSKAIPTEIPNEDLRGHIEQWAGVQDVPAALVYAMIHRESAYNPAAMSPTGVVGIMQVTEKTGRAMSKKLGEKKYNPDRTDPFASTKYGIRYLREMLDTASKACPQCNPLQREYLASASYNQGPSVISRLRGAGADLRNPKQWLPILKTIVIKDKKGNTIFDGPQAANHAEKVMESRQAMTGGLGLVMDRMSQSAMEEFPNPRDYMRAMNRLHKNWVQANSMRQYNANLVYTPPAYDADMARAFVDDQWSRLYDPSAPNQVAMARTVQQSIVNMVKQDTEYGHMVAMEAFEKVSSLMKSGNTEQARRAQQQLSMQGGVLQSLSDAKRQDKMIGGTDPNVVENFLAAAEAGEPVANQAIERYSIGGLKKNGRLGIEQMNLTDQGLRSLAGGGWTPNQVKQFASFLDQSYSAPPEGPGYMMSPEAYRVSQVVQQSRDNMRRLFPGPTKRGANMLAAIDYVLKNAAKFEADDVEAKARLYQILHGKGPAKAWESRTPEAQTTLSRTIYDKAIQGFPALRESLGISVLKSIDQVTDSFANVVARKALQLRPYLDEDTAEVAAEFGFEEAIREGLLGFSEYTYDPHLVSNSKYDPTAVAFVNNPIEYHIGSPMSAPKADVYAQFKNARIPSYIPGAIGRERFTSSVEITSTVTDDQGRPVKETVPLVRGTLQGAAQAAFDDLGIEANVAEEMANGDILLFPMVPMTSPEGRRAHMFQVMRRTRISGTYEGEYRPVLSFDSSEMEDVAATPEFMEMHKQATALAAPMIDVSSIVSRLTGEFRYEEPRYGGEWYEPLGQDRRWGAWVSGAGLGISPLTRGLFEVEDVPERFKITESGIKGEQILTRETGEAE